MLKSGGIIILSWWLRCPCFYLSKWSEYFFFYLWLAVQTRSPAAAYSGPDEPAVCPEGTAFSHGPGFDIHAILTGAAALGHVFHCRCSIESHLFGKHKVYRTPKFLSFSYQENSGHLVRLQSSLARWKIGKCYYYLLYLEFLPRGGLIKCHLISCWDRVSVCSCGLVSGCSANSIAGYGHLGAKASASI